MDTLPPSVQYFYEQVMRKADIYGMDMSIGGRNITDLRYADDTSLIADNSTSRRCIISRVDTAGRKVNLTLNAKKTKVLHVQV